LLLFPASFSAQEFPGGGKPTQYFERASQFAQQGKLDEAAREYRLGLALDPKSAAAYNNLGSIYFQKKNNREAVEAFRHAHDLAPQDPTFSFNLGLALYTTGDSRAAIGPLTLGLAAPDHTVDAHYLLGACYFDLKQWRGSTEELQLARKARPEDDKILFMLVKDFRNVGEPSQSLEAAAQLLKSHPDSPLAHEMLGVAYDTTSQPFEAEKEFKQAIAASPHAPQLHFMLGYLHWRWKHFAAAVDAFQEEIRISPDFAPSYFYLGDIAVRQGQVQQAADYFNEALRLDPSYGEAEVGVGRAYVLLGRYQEALKFLRQAVARLPDQAELHYWLGKALMQVGKSDEGGKELARAHQINLAKDREAYENLKQVSDPAQTQKATPPH
jgi:tetratricopeptide (TPR) repeat protein